MSLPAKHLKVKASTIPQSGKGLFIAVDVPKGSVITEYIGRRATWAEVEDDADNPYIYYIDDENVIDASKDLKSLGRYANDAAGLTRVRGLKNNAEYHEEDNRVFIKAKANIPAGSEIFVSYGRDYWRQVRDNIKLDTAEKSKAIFCPGFSATINGIATLGLSSRLYLNSISVFLLL
ncbi:SET domain-containing protein [Niabella ginsengisoli]|uniref:SET domain-containing protein n=1 Tax=Niabella ginsengisoli TaxID=522298 RepID=A0ABS9SMF3_9BACT|nr:SET domain-containing protein [Niabella ginsengisoli]MCH5599538.1 SET domain-containing protein [Niabella ginsengisoli]